MEPSSCLTQVIAYSPHDPISTTSSNHGALAIDVRINNFLIKKAYVNFGSLVDVLYYQTFDRLDLKYDQLALVRTPLVGFGGHVVYFESMIILTMTMGMYLLCRIIPVNFAILNMDTSYNMHLDRHTVNVICVIFYVSFKFQVFYPY